MRVTPSLSGPRMGITEALPAISDARSLGLTPRAGVTTNYVCAKCAVEIHNMGGWLPAARYFVFGS